MAANYAGWDWLPATKFTSGRRAGTFVSGVVQHYTAAGSARGLAKWIASDDQALKVSAHLIISRSGQVIQQVKFEDTAWHAGTRKGRGDVWLGAEDPAFNVNDITIGLENSNYGALEERAGHVLTPYGKPYKGPAPITAPDHRGIPRVWEPFTDELVQANIEALRRIGDWMAEHKGAVALTRASVAGHSDVSPRRKIDPGPLFPAAYILDEVFGSGGEKPPTVEVAPPGYGRDDIISLIGRDPAENAEEVEAISAARYGADLGAGMCLAPDEDTQD